MWRWRPNPSVVHGGAFLISLWAITWNAHVLAQLPASQLGAVFPAGAAAGSKLELTVSGNYLDETAQLHFSHPGMTAVPKMADPTPFDPEPRPVENVFTVTVAASVPAGRYEIRAQGKYGLSNPRTFMVGTLPEVLEAEPNGGNALPAWTQTKAAGTSQRTNPATELTLPMIANGQSASRADVDWFRFRGSAGQRFLLEGFAKRIDSEIDLVLGLYRSDGRVIAEGRRGPSGDPVISATLASDDDYFVKVHDALYRGGPDFYYRLKAGSLPHLDFVFPPAGQPGSHEQYTVYGSHLPGGKPSDFVVDGNRLEQLQVKIAIPDPLEDPLEFTSLIGPHQAGLDAIEYRLSHGPIQSNPLLITAATAPCVLEQADND
ncbi:MAG: hypothetical protein MI861_24105, partial [Pirellulales bacterium]|nr:hypothetical protein [Pirellulales bacterium]